MAPIQQLVDKIKQVARTPKSPVELHEPCFQGHEWQYVKDCLDSGWVSSVGQYVNEFEKKLATYTETKAAICTANGTAALHAALVVASVERNHEVLVPSLTFIATANAVMYIGATPHFVDLNEKSLGVCSRKLKDYLKTICIKKSDGSYNSKTGKKISALIVMHTFGQPVELEELAAVCDEFKIFLIEDAAEALGSLYNKKHVGNTGVLSILSFNGNKIITTGGGGAILTNNEALAKKAKHITTTAKVAHAFEFSHDEVGYNYRLPNINAALGCAQLENISKYKKAKRALANEYIKAFQNVPGVKIFKELENCESNYWLNTMILEKDDVAYRNEVIKACHEAGIKVRPSWNLLNTLPFYKDCPSMDLSTSRSLSARIINLPSSVSLGEQYV